VPDRLKVKARIVKLTRPMQADEDMVYPDTTTHTLYQIIRVLHSEGPVYGKNEILAVEFSQVDRSATGTEDFRVGDVHQLELIPFRKANERARSARSNDDIKRSDLAPFWVRNRKGKRTQTHGPDHGSDRAPIVMIGNSLQRKGIDFPELSEALGQRVASVESGGQTSAYQLAVLSRYCKAEQKPDYIILLTMRDVLTRPAYNGLGTKWEKPILQALGDDSDLKALMSRLTDPDQKAFNFSGNLEKSFLPLIVQSAREAGIKLIVLRYKTIEFGEERPSAYSDKATKYAAEMAAYFEREGIAYIDYTLNPEITLDMYSKGSHFNELGRSTWTHLVAADLEKILANK
jgi:hypothetical protein